MNGGHGAPAKEWSGVLGPRETIEPGFGAEAHVRKEPNQAVPRNVL